MHKGRSILRLKRMCYIPTQQGGDAHSINIPSMSTLSPNPSSSRLENEEVTNCQSESEVEEDGQNSLTAMEQLFLQMAEQNRINQQILELKKEKLQKSITVKIKFTLREFREYFSSILVENFPGSKWQRVNFDKEVSQDNAKFLVELGRMKEFCRNPPSKATEKDITLAWKFVEALMKEKMGFVYALDKHGLEAAKHIRESSEIPSLIGKIQEEVDCKVKKFRKKKTEELVVSKLAEKNNLRQASSFGVKRDYKKVDDNGGSDSGSKKHKGSLWCGICRTNTHSTSRCRYADRNRRPPEHNKGSAERERRK